MSFVDRCRERHLGSEGGDEGFTLIELLVVLLIIGILLAIAIPTFLSVTKGANNTAAQSNLSTALTGAKTYYTNSQQTYVGIETGNNGVQATSNIQLIDTGVSYVTGTAASTGPHIVSITVTAGGAGVVMTALANGTNDCWGIWDNTQQNATVPTGLSGANGGTPNTWYFVGKNTAAGHCISGTLTGIGTMSPASITTWPAG